MPESTTPEWVKHAIFYQIFPDRFARSERVAKPHNLEPWDDEPTAHGYKGGDLLGVVEHLDYLQDLGITALYFNPIFQSAANHRYHTHDFYQIDPLLGGGEAFDELLAACKQRGMRVVLDGVFNHASRGLFQFNDVLENGTASPWLDWFRFHEFPPNAYDPSRPPGYDAWMGLHALPKFNTENSQVREFLMRVGEYWIRRGADGWRLDVPNEIGTPGFWPEFRRRIKAINPDAYIVGEIWHEGQQWLQGDQFDGVMNYPLTEALIAFVVGHRVVRETIGNMSYWPFPPLGGAEFAQRLEHLLGIYPWPITLTQLNLLDSHDTSRLLTIAGGDVASVRLATLLLLTLPGAPSIYYGDEIGLTGGRPDAMARKAFPWSHPEKWNQDLLRFYKDAIALRIAHRALRTGAYRRLAADGDAFAFVRIEERNGAPAVLIVAVNASDEERAIECTFGEMPVREEPPTILFGNPRVAEHGRLGSRLILPARSGAVLDISQSR